MGTRIIFIFIISVILAGGASLQASAQEKIGGTVEFDRTVYDFGDVLLSDGALKCRFTMKNISSRPVVIYNISTTCGCTDVTWSREPVQPGKTAVISATYTNDEGPYPFDKALTAHISGISRPVVLRIRGTSHQKEEPLEVRFPEHFTRSGVAQRRSPPHHPPVPRLPNRRSGNRRQQSLLRAHGRVHSDRSCFVGFPCRRNASSSTVTSASSTSWRAWCSTNWTRPVRI